VKNPVEYLIYWGNISPERIAIQNSVSHFSYATLLDRVCRIASRLKSLGVRPQQKIVLSMAEDHFRWIFSLALLHIGVKLVSYRAFNPSNAKHDSDSDWIITDKAILGLFQAESVLIDREWLSQVKDFESDQDCYHYKDDDLVCFFHTSGTTGLEKTVAWKLSHMLRRSQSELFNTGLGNKITLMDSTCNLGFYVGFSALMFGETLFTHGSNQDLIELIDKKLVKIVHGSPAQIAYLLETLVEQDRNDLVGRLDAVIAAGSVIPASLLKNIQKYLTSKVYSDYGSTETGFVCSNSITSPDDLARVGYLAPGVEVQIVDRFDSQILNEEVGVIRIKTPYMVTSYFGLDEETARFFKDGWFYPGDSGYLNNQRQLSIVGRTADIINMGGVKVNPFIIEMVILKYAGVKDAAVFTYPNKVGHDELAAAVVSDQMLDFAPLKEALIKEHGSTFCPKRFFMAQKIPRNSNGKVSRHQLASDLLKLEVSTTPKS
jgi:acyl-coenzyme A synthetase/AMP-(fatty) acid ligase